MKTAAAKESGQVFTPDFLVRNILDLSGYTAPGGILEKHVIDNSCGNGAFLKEIVRRYCAAAETAGVTGAETAEMLGTFVHGMENDASVYGECISNLDATAAGLGLPRVKWDVRLCDALSETRCDGVMDFVVGNPPYVRVHNLRDSFSKVKSFVFSDGGMTDMYLAFFELGFRMLSENGRLCYITPSSWFNSLAGARMRDAVRNKRNLLAVVDLAHYQAFDATAYTAISLFSGSGSSADSFDFYKYDENGRRPEFVSKLSYDETFFGGAFHPGDGHSIRLVKKVNESHGPSYVKVKNGFATLADSVFIRDEFPFSKWTIPVLKASTGTWKKAFFPYDENGRPFDKNRIFSDPEIRDWLAGNKDALLKGKSEKESPLWYLFGRTQALKDVWCGKYAVNTCIRDKKSIKLTRVPAACGLYSGLYILTDVPEEILRSALFDDEFIEYVRALKKYKSGGYYTFNSRELELYMNFKMQELISETKYTEYEIPTLFTSACQSDKMTNDGFLRVITQSFATFLNKGTSRNTEKLKPLHGAIAADMKHRLGEYGYSVRSQGIGDGREGSVHGRYFPKKVDILIEKDSGPAAAFGVKFVMQNYSQNANNYFENMLGETANIRTADIPYFQILILPDELPYYNKSKKITRWEKISESKLSKYLKLDTDDTDKHLHAPNKTLLYIIHLPISESVATQKEYIGYFRKNIKSIKISTVWPQTSESFKNTVILNDYEKFADKAYHAVMAR